MRHDGKQHTLVMSYRGRVKTESGRRSKSKRGRYQSVLLPKRSSLFWFIQILRGSLNMKEHTFNTRLAVPQPERTSELVTLACCERPSTPPQSPLSKREPWLVQWKTLLWHADIAEASTVTEWVQILNLSPYINYATRLATRYWVGTCLMGMIPCVFWYRA